MSRADLLALTPDDLASMTNRGSVKRALKELEAGEPSCTIQTEESGDLVFTWSDGITCRFPAGGTVHDAKCSSGLLGISRHVIRSVLAYQQAEAGSTSKTETPALAAATPGVEVETASSNENTTPETNATAPSAVAVQANIWDPGAISDEALLAHFRKPAITQARRRFEQGVVVELTRGAKPVARFLDDNCTVRFLVPGDLRYVSADCAESLWPTWVPLAIWAFRELPAERMAGLVCLQTADLPVPRTVLSNLQALLAELYRDGMNGLAESWLQRLGRIETALRDEGLVWPAELVVDLLHQCEMYRRHDARFEPQQVVHLLGELIARMRAINNDTRAVPQSLVRGSKSDRPTDIAGGRMIAVGLGVRPGKRHTTISAYLQDADSGTVMSVERTFADPDPDSGDLPRSFADLAGTVLVRGVSLAQLATSQLLVKSGKRTASGLLVLPRTASSVTTHPQNFQWEHLKSPFAAESFAQLVARFETLPPACLRPRRRTENLHVIAVTGADQVLFDVSRQQLTARLHDATGDTAELVHPFHARGREGFNEFAAVLEERSQQIRFICGHVRSGGRTLQIRPISLVLEDGGQRIGVLPWLPSKVSLAAIESDIVASETDEEMGSLSPIEDFLQRLEDQLADLVLTGMAGGHATCWEELSEIAGQFGFVQLTKPISALAAEFTERANVLRWDAEPARKQAQELCLLSRLALE